MTGSDERPSINLNCNYKNGKSDKKHPLEWMIFFFVVVSAIATSFAACYTKKQWETAADTEQRSLRAYVLPDGISIINEAKMEDGQLIWELAPWWKNSGSTPTVNATVATGFALTDNPLTKIPFSSLKPDNPVVPIPFPPNGGRHASAGISLNAATMSLVSNRKKHLYIYALMLYDDVFGSHRSTEISYGLNLPNREWNKIEPQSEPGGSLNYFATHNCADEECPKDTHN